MCLDFTNYTVILNCDPPSAQIHIEVSSVILGGIPESIKLPYSLVRPSVRHARATYRLSAVGRNETLFCRDTRVAPGKNLLGAGPSRKVGFGDRDPQWRFGLVGNNVVGRINEVNQRRVRLVLGWVTGTG